MEVNTSELVPGGMAMNPLHYRVQDTQRVASARSPSRYEYSNHVYNNVRAWISQRPPWPEARSGRVRTRMRRVWTWDRATPVATP